MVTARQGDLFTPAELAASTAGTTLPLLAQHLRDWQQRLSGHQAPLFAGQACEAARQGQLFAGAETGSAPAINPLTLQPQPLSFWRWPTPQIRGPALYFVLDRPEHLEQPLLLYVGETARAEQRWKGEHDCKAYLAAYGEALQRAALNARLSISFWSDVPSQTAARRALEQRLIRHWLPPFNKETRSRWATPFQA